MVQPTRESKKLSRNFGWLAFLGILLVIGGLVGLFYTGFATLTSMVLFGWLLLVGGLVGLLQSVQSRGTSFFWLGVVVAALNIAAGVVVIRHPVVTAEALTMFAALLFLTGGLFRVVGSVVVRGPQFGWTLVQGAFGLLLGILVLFDWPHSSLYVLGTFFSLALFFDGLGLVSIGMGGRRVMEMASEAMRPETPETTETPETPEGRRATPAPEPAEQTPDQPERADLNKPEDQGRSTN
ncbi:DUF308 domain-containing protein [Streptomyces sp. NBC_00237]|uniref:HdeD family acid-resistance protein n=1 Tax=Streptomyces sp. NBC_00237 TaxID=2975687 RepID=UPI002253D441|nr:DUF308 domain-containing protein [Streptomyces sp. NBC_00237]MCX5202883.1 DUF308 domain-containing protein [Streptomyces sp. NBC_00237]